MKKVFVLLIAAALFVGSISSAAFAEEYEREASVDELAERMGIPEEEIRILMKASLDAVNLLEH